jgi:hypothetical protein
MPGPEQARAHRRLVTGILEAEVRGDGNRYLETLGEDLDVPVLSQSLSDEPILFADVSSVNPGHVVLGLVGTSRGRGTLAWSLVPDTVNTRFGILGLSLDDLVVVFEAQLPVTGWVEEYLPIDPAWAQRTLYLQGLANGTLTRVIELRFQ